MTEETLRHAKITILEDDVATLCLLKGVMARIGFLNVQSFSHPRGFSEQFRAAKPDLIITDLNMPEMDGFEVLNVVREGETRDSAVPVLVLTADETPQSRRRALAAGATDILVKPFDPSELLMRVRNVLRTRFLQLALSDQNFALEQLVAARTVALEEALAELKSSQQAMVEQERFRAFGEMAGGVVHDFNNALMTIIGYSELLLADPAAFSDPEQARDYLTSINTAGRDASHVVSRLRDFYRPREQGDQFQPLDLNKIVEDAVKLTQPKWKADPSNPSRVIAVQMHLEKGPPVSGNAAELREAVTNLIFNAVDAMPRSGSITLRTRRDKRHVRLEVEDTGAGMSEETRQRCLEPFFTTKGKKGTGLGLPMVFGVIKRHGGALHIGSMLGKGTTMTIRLPVCDDVGGETPGTGEPTKPMRPLNVLVVDDDPGVRDIVHRYLAGDGHRVTAVDCGAEAVREFQSGEFDLLVTDQGMPGMSGVQLARYIRRMRANQPIILLTGFSFDSDRLPPEIDQVLRKPIAPDRLRLAMVQSVRKN